jgi:hypothetical protein
MRECPEKASGDGHLGVPPGGRGSKWNLARLLLAPERARTCRILRRNPQRRHKEVLRSIESSLPAARGLLPLSSCCPPFEDSSCYPLRGRRPSLYLSRKKSRRENRTARLNKPIAGIRNFTRDVPAARLLSVIFTPLDSLLGGQSRPPVALPPKGGG